MRKTFLLNEFLRSPRFLALAPATRGHWLALQALCAERESGGTLEGVRSWDEMAWRLALGVGGGRKAVERIIDAELASWQDEDLVVVGYDLESQETYRQRRQAGAKGGRATAAKARGGSSSARSDAVSTATSTAGSSADSTQGEESQGEASEEAGSDEGAREGAQGVAWDGPVERSEGAPRNATPGAGAHGSGGRSSNEGTIGEELLGEPPSDEEAHAPDRRRR